MFSVRLTAGETLPPLPPQGLRSLADATALPGATQYGVPGAVPSPDSSTYAFQRFSAQRNIYRVPVSNR